MGNKFKNLFLYFRNHIFPEGSLESNALILSGGTGLGLALVVLTTPLITRLYTPEQFGNLSIFLSIVSITSVLACFRYDWALPLPQDKRIALSLLTLCFYLTILTTGVFTLILLFGGEWITLKLHMESLKPYLGLLPLGFFFVGLFNVFNFWSVREKSFWFIAQSKFSNNLSLVIAQLGLGLLNFHTVGLLIGDLFGKFVGALILMIKSLQQIDKTTLFSIKRSEVFAAAKRYHRFPLISGLSTLINSAGLKLPIILFSILFGIKKAGLFSLSQYIFATPMVLIGNSITQAFFAESSQLINQNPKLLLKKFQETSKKLLFLGILIGVVAQLCPLFFGTVFSPSWAEAGEYIRILSILFVIQFIVSPLSHLVVHELQHWQLFWDIFRLIVMLLSFLLAYMMDLMPRQTILLYGILMSLTYVILYGLNLLALKKLINQQK